MKITHLIEATTNPKVKFKLLKAGTHTNESVTKEIIQQLGKNKKATFDTGVEAGVESSVKFTKAKSKK